MRDLGLTSDCESCCGLCCVAPCFSASEDFALDKEAGAACPHLAVDFRCTLHERLEAEGFRGCVVYECHGAGQKVTQITFEGKDWRQTPEIAESMFEVFMNMRQIHELLMYLTEALKLEAAQPLYGELQRRLDELERISLESADSLREFDVGPRKREVDALLLQVGDLVRGRPPGEDEGPGACHNTSATQCLRPTMTPARVGGLRS